MNASALKIALNLRRMSPSDLARKTGITRQAISKWLCGAESWANAESSSLLKVSQALHVDPSIFLKNSFFDVDPKILKQWKTTLLWDRLYDSIESFVAALCREELPAVARYVQTFGVLNAEKVFGKKIFKNFSKFSKFIHPAKRKELEILCNELQALNLI